MTIQERILQVIENKEITAYRFCKDLGLSMGYLDKRGAIGTDKYLKIIEYLPEINPEWLLTGQGSMLKQDSQASSSCPQQNDNEIISLLRDKISLLEKNNALQEEKIAYLEQRLELAELKDKEAMAVKIKKQRKALSEKDAIINLQNEEIKEIKSVSLHPNKPLQPSKRV